MSMSQERSTIAGYDAMPQRKKRVVIVIEGGIFSGMPIKALKIARALSRLGVPVLCVISEEHEGFGIYAEKYGVEIVRLKLHRFRYTMNPLVIARSLMFLIPDIFFLIRVLKRFNATELHSIGPHLFIGPVAAKLAGLKVVWYQGGVLQSGNQHLAPILYNLVFGLADMVVPNSLAVRADVLKNRGRNAIEKVRIIPNFVDTAEFRPGIDVTETRLELSVQEQTVVVTVISAIYPLKGIDVFLRAARRVVDHIHNLSLRFLVVGPRMDLHLAYFDELQRLVEELRLTEFVTFTGPRTDIPKILNATKILVIPSLSEGFPNVALEAMACAVPVVAFAVGGIPEIVRHGETGLLCSSADHDALAKAIEDLVLDPGLRQEIGTRGYEEVKAKYDERVIAGEIANLI